MCTDVEIATGSTVSSWVSFQFYESQMPFIVIDREYFTRNVLAVKGSSYFRIYVYTLSKNFSPCQKLLKRGVIIVWWRHFLKHKNFSQPKSPYSSLYGAKSGALFLFTGKIWLSLSFSFSIFHCVRCQEDVKHGGRTRVSPDNAFTLRSISG